MKIRNVVAAAALLTAIGMGTFVEARGRQESKSTAAVMTVNLNTASQADLEKLPGIGPATARAILDYRQKNGSFKKIEDLMNVKGIGEKAFLKLKPQITVAAAKATER